MLPFLSSAKITTEEEQGFSVLYKKKLLVSVTHVFLMFINMYVSETLPYVLAYIPITRWITCNFTSFSTVFQSYQDDGWMIMKIKLSAMESRLRSTRSLPQVGLKLTTARSVGQCLTLRATGAPGS